MLVWLMACWRLLSQSRCQRWAAPAELQGLPASLILLSPSSPDSLFPLDIGAVKKDHSFLDQDSLKSLCR